MAKSSSMNPMEAERRRQRAKELKKQKEQKQQQKTERLKHMNPQRLERRIAELEQRKSKQNGFLGPDERVLEGLQKDLAHLRRLNGEVDPEEEEELIAEPLSETRREDTQNIDQPALGKESMYYDPEWNPLGKAPEGFPNMKTSELTNPQHYDADPGVGEIPLPSEPKPKFYRMLDDSVKTTYEGRAQVKARDVRLFVPTAVKRKIDQV